MAGLETHSSNPGFCQSLDEDGFDVGRIKVRMWDLHAAAFLVSATVLVIWGRKQYALGGSSGYFVGEALIIFPVHMNLMLALGVQCLIQGALITSMGGAGISLLGDDQSRADLQINLVANTFSYFLQVSFLEH